MAGGSRSSRLRLVRLFERRLAQVLLALIFMSWLRRKFFTSGSNFNFVRRIATWAYGLRKHTHTSVHILSDQGMRTRDGARLMSTVYLPFGRKPNEKRPVILIRTPYSRHLIEFPAQRFAERGYIVVAQDVRGRFDSSGTYAVLADARKDGVDTLRWMASQAWYSGGKVGVWGISYLGCVQWAAAAGQKELESECLKQGYAIPKIAAMVPIMATSNIFDALCPGGAPSMDLLGKWLFFSQYFGSRSVIGIAGVRMKRARHARSQVEFNKIMFGTPKSFIHAPIDAMHPFWRRRDNRDALSSSGCGEDPPPRSHLIGGWYDFFLQGQISDFERLQEQKNSFAYLTIGPWHHLDSVRFGTFRVLMQESMSWFDATLWPKADDLCVSGSDRDELLTSWREERRLSRLGHADDDHWEIEGDELSEEGSAAAAASICQGPPTVDARMRRLPVKLWVMDGSPYVGEWREFAKFPPPGSVSTPYYLCAGGGLSSFPPSSSHISEYIYDPLKPTPSRGGPMFDFFRAGASDQSSVEARGDVLTFTSDSLNAPLEIIGTVVARLFVMATAIKEDALSPDSFDVIMRICDVDESEKSINVCEGIQRVSNTTAKAQQFSPLQFSDESFLQVSVTCSTAWRFRAGHRIRVQICSGAHPRLARNWGTEASVKDPMDGKEFRRCLIRLSHAPHASSAVVLPVALKSISRGVASASAGCLRHSGTASLIKSPSSIALNFMETLLDRNHGVFQ